MVRQLMKYVIFFSLILSFSACNKNHFVDIEEVKKDYSLEKLPIQEDFPEADGVIIFEKHDSKMKINEDYSLSNYEEVHVLTKLFKNIEDHATIEIPVYEGEELLNVYARTIKPEGESVILEKNDFYTITGSSEGATFYSDKQTKKFTFPAIEKNCLIEYRYKKHKEHPFRFDVWSIQHRIPTLNNTYSLIVPNVLMDVLDWSWRCKTYAFENIGKPIVSDPEPFVEGRHKKKTKFSWIIKDIPAFIPEPMMPPFTKYQGHVKFAPSDWKEWDNLTEWYYDKMFKPQLVIDDQIKELANDIIKDDENDIAMIKSIYNYVQDIRYIAIQLGIGGIRPSEPQEVINRQYGDCKDKSILLISLLKAIGISAKPVLTLTANEGIIDPYFPSWNFNHMIVKTETENGDTFWLDPTTKYSTIYELPWVDEGINVIVINDDGKASVESTPGSDSKINIIDIQIKVDVTSKNKVNYAVKLKYCGEFNSVKRKLIEEYTEKDLNEYCTSMIIDEFLNTEIANVTYSELNKYENDFVFEFDLVTDNAIQKQGDLLFLNTNILKFINDFSWLVKKERKYPIEFNFPITNNISFEINYPEDVFMLRNIPENSEILCTELYYERSILNNRPGYIKFVQNFEILNYLIIPENYPRVIDFFEQMNNDLNKKIIFTSNK